MSMLCVIWVKFSLILQIFIFIDNVVLPGNDLHHMHTCTMYLYMYVSLFFISTCQSDGHNVVVGVRRRSYVL